MWSINNSNKDGNMKYNAIMHVKRDEFNDDSTHDNNMNRFYKKTKPNLLKSRDHNNGQLSVKKSSSPQKSCIDPVERTVKDDLQKCQRFRQLEYTIDEQRHNYKERQQNFQSRYSCNPRPHESFYSATDAQNNQQCQNKQGEQQQQQQQKKESTRRKPNSRSEHYEHKHISKIRKMPLMDECHAMEDNSTTRREKRQKDVHETEDKLDKVEKKQLHLMQSIQCHQRALVAETKQLFRNEQKQQRLRKDTVEHNMAEFMKKLDSKELKQQKQEQKRKFRNESVSQNAQHLNKPTIAPNQKVALASTPIQSRKMAVGVTQKLQNSSIKQQKIPVESVFNEPISCNHGLNQQKFKCNCISDANKVAAFLSPRTSDRTQRSTSVESYRKSNEKRRQRNYTAPMGSKSVSQHTNHNYLQTTNELNQNTQNDLSLLEQSLKVHKSPTNYYDARSLRS